MLQRGNSAQVAIPDRFRDTYVARIINQEFTISKKGNNPMIVLDWELVAHINGKTRETSFQIQRNGIVYIIAGFKWRTWHTITERALENYYNLRTGLGLPDNDPVDETNPPLDYIGKQAYVVLDYEDQEQRAEPTEEQKIAGQQGEALINPATGNPIVRRIVVMKGLPLAPCDSELGSPF